MASKGDLDPPGKCLEFLADLRCPRGIQLVDHGVLELHLQPDPVVRIPAERCPEDLLVAAKDTAGDALRYAGGDIAVQIHDTPARAHLLYAEAGRYAVLVN